MSTWKRLSNLGKGKLKTTLDDLGTGSDVKVSSDRVSEEIAALRALDRELRDQGVDPSDPGDPVARARAARERLEAARALRDEAPAVVRSGRGASGSPSARSAGKTEKYEPPGPPEELPDGSVKLTL